MMRTSVRAWFIVALMLISAGASACEIGPEGGEARERYEASAPSVEVASGKSREARSMVQNFMDRRIAGNGANRFLDADGREVFGSGGPLSPLYPTPPLRAFEVVFVDDLGDGTYEVGVDLVFDQGSYGETLFVHRDEGWIVSGGRPGLEGP